MDRDELREKIATVILEQAITIHGCSAPCNCRSVADSILSLLAPVLADAEKWDRVKELAERNWLDEYPCEGCSVESMCDSSLSLCGQADSIVTALEGEGEKG